MQRGQLHRARDHERLPTPEPDPRRIALPLCEHVAHVLEHASSELHTSVCLAREASLQPRDPFLREPPTLRLVRARPHARE